MLLTTTTSKRPRRLQQALALLLPLLFGLWQGSATAAASGGEARGVVFHDKDGDGLRDLGEPGLPGVGVSNGRAVVETDEAGTYRIPVTGPCEIFVIKPRGWAPPLDQANRPQFFYIHRPDGSPRLKYGGIPPTGELPTSIDFALTPQVEQEQFQALLFGDPQPRNQREVDWLAHDIVEDLIGFDGAFGVSLGDVAFDNLNTLEPLAQVFGKIGIPQYYVVGNHDLNYDATTDRWANETFIRHFGPSNFSYNWGAAHFVVLDDVVRFFVDGEGQYRGEIDEVALDFVRNDLVHVPNEKLLVFLMHIPLNHVENAQEFFELFADRPHTLSIAAHMHFQEHLFLGKEDGWRGPGKHHHVVVAAGCGSWFTGAPDEDGIPHTTMRDGAPNGYALLTTDGSDYRIDFRAARRPAGHQMTIDLPEVVAREKLGAVRVAVNLFNGSERSSVATRVDAGSWTTAQQERAHDPLYVAARNRELALTPSPGRELPEPMLSPHLWFGTLPTDLSPGLHELEVRTVDMWGRVLLDRRLFRVR